MRSDFLELKQHTNEIIQKAGDEIKEVKKDDLAVESGNREVRLLSQEDDIPVRVNMERKIGYGSSSSSSSPSSGSRDI
jgi:hypothetical protein